MRKFLRNDCGSAAVEFGLAALPLLFLVMGIIQTGYVVWVDNLLHFSVDTAARCGGIGSTTSPCAGSDMIATANIMFQPLTGASFSLNTNCSSKTTGLVGSYTVSIGFMVDLSISANSCYPLVTSN